MALWYARFCLLAFIFFFILSIGLSRVVLGLHSWDQVLFGFCLGFWLALTCHYCIKERAEANWTQIFGNEVQHSVPNDDNY